MIRVIVFALFAHAVLEAQAPTLQQFLGSGLMSGSYVSGGTISGPATSTCQLVSFNGGGSGAQATLTIPIGGVIPGTAINFGTFNSNVNNSHGSGYLAQSTTATLQPGTGGATCSGQVTVMTATAEASNRAQIYASLQGKPFPAPAFGAQLIAVTDVACGQIQIAASSPTPCIFSTAEEEAEVDLLAQNPPNGLGVSVIQINFDPYYWIDNTGAVGCTACSPAARALFQDAMTYIYAHYGPGSGHAPVVHVRLEPSYVSGNLGTVCHALVSSVPTTLTGPADIATCVTSVPTSAASWLRIGSTQFSVYGYLAAFYGPGGSVPVMQDFTDLHEPTTTNANYGWNGSSAGTPGDWQGAYNTMAALVNSPTNGNAQVYNGIAFDRFERTYATQMLGTSPGLSPIRFVGGDEYTTGINNNNPNCPAPSCGDMYNISAILSFAAGPPYSLRVLFTESWVPAWVPLNDLATDANAFEGIGNCDWQTLDFIRQSLTATTMWASANGLSEVNFFNAANTSTTCVYPGYIDSTVDTLVQPNHPQGSYLTAVATASNSNPTLKTRTFYWLQQLINNWMAVVAAGQPLPM